MSPGEPIFSTEALALNDDIWPIIGAKCKTQAHSIHCDSVQVRSNKGRAKSSFQPCASDALQLSNKFQTLVSGDRPCSPVGFQLEDHPSSARASVPWLLYHCYGLRQACCCPGPAPEVVRCAGVHTQVRCLPSVLVVGTSMVRHVVVRGGWTFCYPGACIKDITPTALQLSLQHKSASAVVVQVSTNDVKNLQLENEYTRRRRIEERSASLLSLTISNYLMSHSHV